MQYSVVNYKDVLQANSDLRIDGEYFKPEYLISEKRIEKVRFDVLGKIANIKGGKRLPLGETFSADGIPYIRAEDIRVFADFMQAPKISLELHRQLKSYQTKYNDVLLTIVGNSIGDVGIVKFKLDKCNLTENCARMVNPKGIVPEFLFAFLSSKYGQNQIHREKVGTAQPKLALVRIRKFKIPLLSERFQSIIEGIINNAYQANDKSNYIYSQAEQILLSELGLLNWCPKHRLSFVRNFSDTQSADRIDAEYFQPMYEEVEDILSQRNRKSLESICSLINYGTVPTSPYVEKGTPYIKGSNLIDGLIQVI